MHSFETYYLLFKSREREKCTPSCVSEFNCLISITILNFLQGEAVTSLVGHTQCVSSVVWPEYDVIYSSSWDHSVKRWDVETGKDSLNLVYLLSLLFFLIYSGTHQTCCC